MLFVGVDPSLKNTGVALIDSAAPDQIRTYSIGAAYHDRIYFEWQLLITRDVLSLVEGEPDVFVCIEIPPVMFRGGLSTERHQLMGMLCYALYRSTVRYPARISPATVKKFVGCKKKTEILSVMRRRWGDEIANNDESDAAVMAMVIAAAMGYSVDPLNRAQVEAVQKLMTDNPVTFSDS